MLLTHREPLLSAAVACLALMGCVVLDATPGVDSGGGSPPGIDGGEDGGSGPMLVDSGREADTGPRPDDASSPLPDAGMDGTDAGPPHPDLALLLDPDRPSRPYECEGAALTREETVALFAPGEGALFIGGRGDPRVAVELRDFSRTCAPLTGCSEWTSTTPSFSSSLAFVLFFTAEDAHALAAIDYKPTILSGPWVAVDSGDFLFPDESFEPRLQRARLTRGDGGAVCVSVASALVTWGEPMVNQRFSVLRGTIAAPPPRADAGEAPPLAGVAECGPVGSGTSSLVSAWFEPGTSIAPLTALPLSCARVYRACHAVTGCTPWMTWGCIDSYFDPRVGNLHVSPSGLGLRARIGLVGDDSEPDIVGGEFAATLTSDEGHVWSVSGVASEHCVGWQATTTHPLEALTRDAPYVPATRTRANRELVTQR